MLGEQVVVEVAERSRAARPRAAVAVQPYGWMKPSRPEVVSGVRRSAGSAATTCAASRAALTSLPFAKPGWTSTPWIVTRDLGGGERLVLQLADLGAVDRVGAARAEALDVEQRRALADLLVGREADPQRRAAAARGARRGRRPRP